jgi:TolA-binding protein
MRKPIIIFGFAFVLLLLSAGTFAQQTVYNSPINITYREASSLFNQHNYGSALMAFEKYMSEEQNKKSASYEDAVYYSTVCSVKLGNKNAINKVKKFMADYPASTWIPTINFELGNIYYKDKKYSKALDTYNSLSESKIDVSQRSEYLYKKGYCQMKQSQFDQALASYRKVMDTESSYAKPANYYFAHIQYQKGNIEEALIAFKTIESDRKFRKHVPLYLIKIYYQQGEYKTVITEGVKYMPKAAKQEKSNIARLIANSYYNLNNFEKAYEYFAIYESRGKRNDDPAEQYRIGYSKYVVEKFKDAIRNFQEATKAGGIIEQNSWYYLGYCYLYTSQTKFAQNAFLKAYNQNTNKDIAADALFSYVKITIEAGADSFNDPVEVIEEFIQNNPNSSHVATSYDLLSQLYLTSRNYSGALISIEKVKNPNARLKSVYQQLAYAQGITYYKQRAYADAIVFFKKSLKYQVDTKLQSEAMYWQADALYHQKKFSDAASLFYQFRVSKGVKQTDLYGNALYNSAYCYFNTKQYNKAVNLFQQFLKQKNNNVSLINDSYLRLADSYIISKDYKNAIVWYDKVIFNNSVDADYALYQKAICYGSQGDFKGKLATLSQLTRNHKRSQYYDDALYDIASTNLILNDQRHAIVYFQKLVKEKPKSSYAKKALVKMGFVYYSNNQYEQSIKALKQVIDNYPASLEAKEALVTLQNVYMDMGKVDNYIEYTNTLDFIQVSISEEDSLKFTTGENYYMNNDCINATMSLTNYVNQFPTGGFVITAYHYLSQCADKRGDADKAITYYEKILEFPENQYTVKALLKVARVMYENEEFEKSLNYYQQLAQLADNKLMLLEATDGVMKSAWKTGDIQIVKESAKKLLMTEKVSEDQIVYAHYLLGMIAMDNKQYSEAEKELTITTKLSNGVLGAEALYNTALIMYRKNKLEDAENLIYELPEKYPSFEYWRAKGYILIADIYVGRDDLFQAELTLKSVIENYKGGDLRKIAQEKLDRIMASQIEEGEEENENP